MTRTSESREYVAAFLWVGSLGLNKYSLEDETGIDPRDFRQAVAFANTCELVQFMNSPYPGGPYWGALLKGSFAEKRMVLTIAGLFGHEFENYKYKGAKIYTFTEGREVLFSFTFVNNELIVVGSTRAVDLAPES